MPYPCNRFYADIRFDNRFNIRIWNSIHVKPYHKSNLVTKFMFPKFDIKSVVKSDSKFDISIKPTPWIEHKSVTYHATLLKFHTNPWDFFQQDQQWLKNQYKHLGAFYIHILELPFVYQFQSRLLQWNQQFEIILNYLFSCHFTIISKYFDKVYY